MRAVLGAVLALLLAATGYAAWVVVGSSAGVAAAAGTRTGLAVSAAVTIARDARGVPHIRAATDRDAFFAEGYALGEDRLFQADLIRRYVLGRLAEVLGPPLVPVDRHMRSLDVAAVAARAERALPPDQHALLAAFVDGLNAAAAREPAPPEYRALFLRWEPWRPADALAVAYATVLELDDQADWIGARDWIHRHLGAAGTDAFLPLTDPKYDVPADNRPPGPLPSLPPLPGATPLPNVEHVEERAPVGSNAWAAGANRTLDGRAVLANDPHLSLGVPSTWWLVELRSPGYHLAGAVLPGAPGVTLGHGEHVAWGVTAGETAAMRLVRTALRGTDEVFIGGRWVRATHRREHIAVRLGAPVDAEYLDTPLGTLIGRDGDAAYLRDWPGAQRARSGLDVFLALGRARSVDDALGALRGLVEPPLNVVLVDDAGRAAYHLAGAIPLDDVAGRWAVDADAAAAPTLPFDRAPQIAPSRDAVVETSNQRAGGAGSPRLAPFWEPPYRAYEVRRQLDRAAAATGGRLSVDALAAPQRDVSSPAEAELARLATAAAVRKHADVDPALAATVAALRDFDGSMVATSRGASVVSALRIDLLNALAQMHLPRDVAAAYVERSGTLTVPLRALRERPRGWVPHDDWDGFVVESLRRVRGELGDTPPPFGTYGAQPLRHPLSRLGFQLWNVATLEGRGGRYAPAVQWRDHGQSFRALWIAGDWDRSTIDIAPGESGEPGSPHYHDLLPGWLAGARNALPFSDEAVRAATKTTLTLSP